ncbi:WhiB family transcriptional regulator [Streptomyces sp. NPDC004230]
MNWREAAACRTEDPELFFPISASGPGAAQTAAAKAVCLRCSVRSTCLDWALNRHVQGVWGGTTESERRAMPGHDARERARSTAETAA